MVLSMVKRSDGTMGDDLIVISDSEDEEYPSISSWNSHRRSGGVRSRENLTPNQSEKVGNDELESDVILLSSETDSDSDSDLPDPFTRDDDDGKVKRKKRQKKSKKKANVQRTECQTRHARVKQEVNESYEDLAFQAETNRDSDQDNSRHLRNGPTSEDPECDDREVYPSSGKSTCPSCVDFSEPFSPSGGAEPDDQMGNSEGFDTRPFQPVLDDQIEYSSSMHRDTSSPEQKFATDCTDSDSDGPGGSSDQEQDGPLDNSIGQYFPTDSQLSCSLDSEDTEDQKSLSAEATAFCGKEADSGLSNLSNGHLPGRDSDCPEKSDGKKTLPCLRNAWSPSELDPQQRFLLLQGDESESISFSQDTPSNSVTLSPALSHCESQDIHVSTLSPDNSMTSGSKKCSPMKKKKRFPNLSRGEKLPSTLKENEKQREKNETITAQDNADIASTYNPSNKSPVVSSQTASTSVKDIPSTLGNQPSSSSMDSSETPSKFGNLSMQGQSSLSHSNEVCFETMQVDSRTFSRDNPSVSTPTKSIDNGRTASAGISNGLDIAPTSVLSNRVGRRISCGHPSVFTPSASASVTNGRRASTGMSNGLGSEPISVLPSGVRSISSGHPSVSTPSASASVTNGRRASTGSSIGLGSEPISVLPSGVRSISSGHPSVSTSSSSSSVTNGRRASTARSIGFGSEPISVLPSGVRSISSGHPSVSTPSASASVTNGRRASTGSSIGLGSEPISVLPSGVRSISSSHPSVSTPSSSSTVSNGRTTPAGISNKSGSASTPVLSNGVSRSFNPSGTSNQQCMESSIPPKNRWHHQTSSVPSGSHGSEVSTMTEETGIKEALSCILSWKCDRISSSEGVPSANVLQSFLGCREVPRHQDAFQDIGSYQMSLICFLLLEMWSKVSSAVHRECDVAWRQIPWLKQISEAIVEVKYEPIDSSHQGLIDEDLVLVDMTATNAVENQYQFGLVRGVSDGTVTLALPYKNKVVPRSTRLKVKYYIMVMIIIVKIMIMRRAVLGHLCD
ncbi:mucin-4-like [Lytechinus pictus]|uniref:mucin-4-like n=1 Tax=Lytechinus pictus TaxID=7653 RepID=UPI0030B9B0CF